MTTHRCQVTGEPLTIVFADLGEQPLANSLERAGEPPGPTYPLVAYISSTGHVQVPPHVATADMFDDDYTYFSSFSTSWVAHAKRYAEAMIPRFGLGADSLVIEIASNDGYLLQWFVERGVPVLGVEPAGNTAAAARERGVDTDVAFFGQSYAKDLVAGGRPADLIVANNVLAHQSSVLDFLDGVRIALKDDGVATFEFPHLANIVRLGQFDTIYHEHYSYLSLGVVADLCDRVGLQVFDVEELPTHGGSLRVFAQRADVSAHPVTAAVGEVIDRERADGILDAEQLAHFAEVPGRVRAGLLAFLDRMEAEGKRVVGYGAPAKGVVLLNHCGIGPDRLPFTVDRSPHKQGRLIPGVRIPIEAPERIMEERPDVVLILPWNIADEIEEQLAGIREWGGQFAVAVPEIRVW